MSTTTTNTPLISIIIPCYNCDTTLREAVESCYTQGFTEHEFEIVMVDDCSTDNTYVCMEKLASEHSNIKIYKHDINKGGGATRNTATALASAELIFCLDSDDILSDNMLQRMVTMQKDTNADGICIETSIKFRGTNIHDVAFVTKFGYGGSKIPTIALLELQQVMCPLYSTFLYTKKAFEVLGGYPTAHGFDTQGIAWRFVAHGLTAYTCPDTVYYHRIHHTESYYLRERNAGRANINWKIILLENNTLLTDEAFAFVRNFNERNFAVDIMGQLRQLPSVFATTPQQRNTDLLATIPVKPVPYNSLLGKYYRLKNRLTAMSKKITSKIKAYIHFLTHHLDGGGSLYGLYAWHGLRLQRMLKIKFNAHTTKTNDIIDLYLVTTSKDFPTLGLTIEAAKKHVCHTIKNVYVITRENADIQSFCKTNGYHFIDENSVLGYGKDAIDYTVDSRDRSGWLFQQLLKFNGDAIAESENFLSICTDTILIRPHQYLDGGKIIFRQNDEWHPPYFKNFEKIFKYPVKTWFSYTSHMMMFNKTMLREMKREMEVKNPGMTWDQIYINTKTETEQSCISDYDTYANWVRCNYPKKVINTPLYNSTFSRDSLRTLTELESTYKNTHHSVSFHSYATPNNSNKTVTTPS